MNKNNSSLKILLVSFAVMSIIGAYYIGYMTARLGLSAPFLPNNGTTKQATAPSDAKPEPKMIEEVSAIKLDGDEVFYGDANSKFVMVTFTDFQCPFCARFHPSLIGVQKATNSKLVFKHFPLSFHQYAKDLAHTFECIAKNSSKDNAVAFADSVFESNLTSQGQITFTEGKKLANKFLNDDVINGCLKDDSITKKIERDYQEGLQLGIQGTPALYIMNTQTNKAVRINGALDQASIQAEFDKLK